MNDANVKVGTHSDPVNDIANGAKPRFDLPIMNFQEVFRDFAEQGAAMAKKHIESMKATSEEISDVLREACSMNVKGVVDYGARVMEMSKDNTSSSLEFLSRLAETRSLLDVVHLSTAQSREAFEVASTQNRELWQLAQRVAIDTTDPIKAGFNRVLNRTVA
ncbi:phasin family protein [Bradyrhizobium daqingense]|uniref:Phasin n=1 Tax=Bradyrhizobium daqingense TaxID=993502 RepID=A0A562KZ55_9BRAD|nr:phasin family protein [Bradyrhizobium daqingense]TWI00675.1 phasin [Bradyrhizobium daqingense]UFS88425.1 phasin family protein [Bradyrhizobium daqingense]